MHGETFVVGCQLRRKISEFTVVVCLSGGFKQFAVCGFAEGPQHALDRDDVAPLFHLLFGEVQIVFFEGTGNFGVPRSFVIGLHDAEIDAHGPHGLDSGISEFSRFGGVFQRIPDTGFSFFDQIRIPEQIAQAEQAVAVIGRLLVSPPVASVAVGISPDLPGPKRGVIGIGERFGMSRESGLLTTEELFDPTLRFDVDMHAALKDGVGSLGSDLKAEKRQQKRDNEFFHDVFKV